MAGNGFGNRQHMAQIGATVFARRGAHGDEMDVGVLHR